MLQTYSQTPASVRKLPLCVSDSVGAMELQRFRDVFDVPLEGILGMDFLAQHVVHVNFDKGELLLLRAAPSNTRDVLPRFWQPGANPAVDGYVAGGEKTRFLIDTGQCGGSNSGSLSSQQARRLASNQKLRKVGALLKETLTGTSSSSCFQGNLLAVGGFAIEDPVFSENPTRDILGLAFWSRFAVTFDFPGRRILLRKGADYTRRDRWNLSGLHLVRSGEAVVVHSVDEQSLGWEAGVRKGDVLLKLGGRKADEARLFELRSALCSPGRVDCLLRRGPTDVWLTLNLAR